MASDGSQPVEWNGAFPFLPSWLRPKPSESYADARHGHSGPAAHEENHNQQESDRTGVWNGPAPRGYVARPTHAADEPADAPVAIKEADYVTLPGGAHMPLIGLGTYAQSSADAVRNALAAGYRHIDCAPIYGNEALVGEGLRDFLAQEEGAREQLWITSKIWNDSHRPAAVRASAEKSIADLGAKYLDLLLIHWPDAFKPGTEEVDTEVTLQETWQAMEALVEEGLVKHIGVSNFSLSQVEDVLSWAKVKPVVNQIELHPLLAQRKILGVCSRKGVRCVGYSPLGHSKNDLLEHPEVVRVASEVGKAPAQVLLRWNVQRGVAVIPKAGSEPHMKENIAGLCEWRLSWDQKAALDALNSGKRFVDMPWHQWADDEEGGAVKPSTVLL
ncbi:hypothetical protein Ndes2526B_g02402 [Nannochloris sp. 'desiccata']